MGVNHLSAAFLCTLASILGLHLKMYIELVKLKQSKPMEGYAGYLLAHALESIRESRISKMLLAFLVLNMFILAILILKKVFFSQLYPSERKQVIECVLNNLVYKGMFLLLVVPPAVFQTSLWSSWLIILSFLKIFQAVARSRLDMLHSSPSATPWKYFCPFSVLVLVVVVDLFWIRVCKGIYDASGSTMYLLLFFEPGSIMFGTFQAIMVHGFQFLEMWHQWSANGNGSLKRHHLCNMMTGSIKEWSDTVNNMEFILEIISLTMTLGHYLHIWWLRGIAFHVVDAMLLLNLRALGGQILRRVKGFLKLKQVVNALNSSLPDATVDELKMCNTKCSICRDTMVKAKRLPCNHSFHLTCLWSWLVENVNALNTCPTCRRPIFAVVNRACQGNEATTSTENEQLARCLSSRMGQRRFLATSVAPVEMLQSFQQSFIGNSQQPRGESDEGWVQPWQRSQHSDTGLYFGGSSARFGGVQMMMRNLTAASEAYARPAFEDRLSRFRPLDQSSFASFSSLPAALATEDGRSENSASVYGPTLSGLHTMADAVKEVLPHIADDVIIRDLQRTNSVAATVNNLLQL